MAANLAEERADELLEIDDIRLSMGRTGIKQQDRDDLTLIVLGGGHTVGVVSTRNRLCVAPVYIAKSRLLDQGGVGALVVNTDNVNAGTGAQGCLDAIKVCAAVAEQVGCQPNQAMSFSTDVILEPLSVDKIVAVLPQVHPVFWSDAARTIMMTGTMLKVAPRIGLVGEKHTVRATGVAKGSGMIHLNMVAMLSLTITDARVSQSILQLIMQEIVNESFNTITVNGDTSTNDSFAIMATSRCGQNKTDNTADPCYAQLKVLLGLLALELVQAIVRDGEGAIKSIMIRMRNAKTHGEACKVTHAVAHSPLVKTTFSTFDPNLGRLLVTVSYAGVEDLNVDASEVWLDDALVAENDGHTKSYTEEARQAVMNRPETTIHIDLQRGDTKAVVYTRDLSHECVSINADYHS